MRPFPAQFALIEYRSDLRLESSVAEPWPVLEAKKIVERLERYPHDGPVLFETGFGPSGLPHIGTFAEVARTTFVRQAFRDLTDDRVATRLLVFSDDMDGLRAVPKTIPNPHTVQPHLGKPLTSIPDPFGTEDSFAGHMNQRLVTFLDSFGFDYELASSTKTYQAGKFDDALHRVAVHHDEIVHRVTKTMRPENRVGWSPFLPLCPECGRLMSTVVVAVDPDRDELEITCAPEAAIAGCGFSGRVSYHSGKAKLRWKADWALRWTALGVDYEMYGKDLNDTVSESRDICTIIGGHPPEGMFYEMFLNPDGAKISKSVGDGITVDEWARWAPLPSLLMFLYGNPRKAKKLSPDTVLNSIDQWLGELRAWPQNDVQQQLWSPLRFVHRDVPPPWTSTADGSLVRSLVAVLGHDEQLVHAALAHNDPNWQNNREIGDALVSGAIAFLSDNADRTQQPTAPEDEDDRSLLASFADWIEAHPDADADEIQGAVFDLVRAAQVKPPHLFRLIYQALLGQDRGPRIGTFTLLLGRENLIRRIREILAHTGDGGRDP